MTDTYHQEWLKRKAGNEQGVMQWQEVGDGQVSIRITGWRDNTCINTNNRRQSGLVCFLPAQYGDCGILAVKITNLTPKSAIAIPVDYIEFTDNNRWFNTGDNADTLMQHCPNAKRVTSINNME